MKMLLKTNKIKTQYNIMRKFSDMVNENESLQKFKFTAKVDVEGFVEAHNIGEAGELADKEMDEINGLTNYQIIDIKEADMDATLQESVSINESVDPEKDSEVEDIIKKCKFFILSAVDDMSDANKAKVFKAVKAICK